MLPRLAIVIFAAGAVAVGVAGTHRTTRCDAALAAAGAVGKGDSAQVAASAAGRVRRWCRDPTQAVTAAARLGGTGHTAQALAIAADITAKQPQNYLGWLAVGRLTGTRTPEGRASLQRAYDLNPRGQAREADREMGPLNRRRTAAARGRAPGPPTAAQALAALARSVGAGP